ncbi:hypothetical protein RHMOL_Rhmol11G0068200 [Rhododendron molle]|uniref:Uncharacterized protein n=1 Tax=Rhododendron molle TaxID=49168 RepID=A0ACC0LPA3_RHOML|nr:hypothetical protein RHMOL_Rhmol11G0068200 [Rhododendron molle]
MSTYKSIQLHHGGHFNKTALSTMYLGGTCEMIDNIDIDLISFFDLREMVMSYGYPCTVKMYYLLPGAGLKDGIKEMCSDEEVTAMLDAYEGLPILCMYVTSGPMNEVVGLEVDEDMGVLVDEEDGEESDDPNYEEEEEKEDDDSYVPTRDIPIVSMLEWIRRKLMSRFQIKRMGMEKYTGTICPKIEKKLDWRIAAAKDCFAYYLGEFKFVVDCHDTTYTVDLNAMTCGCRLWGVMI